MTRWSLPILLALIGSFRLAEALPSPPPGVSRADILPFKEVAAGMKGIGRTVFKGTTVEEFNVEIIATMENILPKKNLILARLDGGPLRDTGIMEGMSGSPVYIGGKLVGAVSYSWGFAKEPICGITPIEEMLDVLDRGTDLPAGTAKTGALVPSRTGEPAPVSLLAWPERIAAFLGAQSNHLAAVMTPGPVLPASLSPLRPTLVFSGYRPEAARALFPLFESMSLH
ncbi:MAG TPA: SpoIVB peptidase S55 domain-containing protein, partial [Patescibacteria group bacterium]|nr:SpoIVB peptidase S55 domain-containing protein [Patescibacteria group bacterium]